MVSSSARRLSVRDLNASGKRVLVRCDLNVPLAHGAVADGTRIRASLPTIRHLTEAGARVILMSHLGRPKGRVVPDLSLAPVAGELSRELGMPVAMAPDCVGPEVMRLAAELGDGEVLLLENLRFHAEETANEESFAKGLAALADLFVSDAFGTAHRAHASTAGAAAHFEQAAAGFLLEKELAFLGGAVTDPERPCVAILGGAKISGKMDVLENLLDRMDSILIGGAMAGTFFRALGLETGNSLVEEDRIGLAKGLLARASENGRDLRLPVDGVVASAFDADADASVVPVGEIPVDRWMLDVGPETVAEYRKVILGARTVLWNGPMGVFEMDRFAEGTLGIARAMAEATDLGATTIIGGGDSAAAIAKAACADRVSHVSTGGGASLEFLEGKLLPGVAALTEVNS